MELAPKPHYSGGS